MAVRRCREHKESRENRQRPRPAGRRSQVGLYGGGWGCDGGGEAGRCSWLCPERVEAVLGRKESLLGSGGGAVITKRVSEKQKRGRVLSPPL